MSSSTEDQSQSCSLHDNVEHYNSTEMIVREDILSHAKDLATLITTSDEVQFYKQAEKKLDNHPRVQEMIQQIKKKQKEIVAFEQFKNAEMVEKIEKEIAEIQDELDAIPIVSEFKQSQDDLNYMLQLIIGVIRDTVSQKITVEKESAEPRTLELEDIE